MKFDGTRLLSVSAVSAFKLKELKKNLRMVNEYMERPNVGWTAYSSRIVDIGVESVSLNAHYVHVYLAN